MSRFVLLHERVGSRIVETAALAVGGAAAFSLQQIADKFNKRDHTTVMAAGVARAVWVRSIGHYTPASS